ncbi:MAG: hypothetical protein QNJ31_09020 [Candidatus Caenarcaniphilales bacterium]|nr:hypothetical protein [Candidatus Caenarcaniphilales bacterium]
MTKITINTNSYLQRFKHHYRPQPKVLHSSSQSRRNLLEEQGSLHNEMNILAAVYFINKCKKNEEICLNFQRSIEEAKYHVNKVDQNLGNAAEKVQKLNAEIQNLEKIYSNYLEKCGSKKNYKHLVLATLKINKVISFLNNEQAELDQLETFDKEKLLREALEEVECVDLTLGQAAEAVCRIRDQIYKLRQGSYLFFE